VKAPVLALLASDDRKPKFWTYCYNIIATWSMDRQIDAASRERLLEPANLVARNARTC